MFLTFPGLRRADGRLAHDIVASLDCFLLFLFVRQLRLMFSCLFEDFGVANLEDITSVLLLIVSPSVDLSGLDGPLVYIEKNN